MQPLSLAWLKKVSPDLLSLVAIAVVLVIPALLFSQSAYLEVAGQDNYATHWQLTDKATIGQTITPTKDILSAIGILLVPYGASNLDGEIILSLKSATGEELRRATIPAQGIKDDKYDIFNFSPLRGIAHQELTIELRTTAPIEQTKVAARFDPRPKVIKPGTGLRHGIIQEGDLALQLYHKTNYYGYLKDLWHNANLPWHLLVWMLSGGALASALFIWLNGKPRLTVHRWQVSKLVLVTVLLSSTLLVWHVSNLSEARGVSGGDPYNFFFIVERIQTNLTFYNPEQKRLPVWPLVLIPSALSTSDIVLSARLINLFIAAATLLVLAWLGTQLKLPRPAIALAVLLTALNRDFMLITYRPLAYPLVGLLLLLSLTTLFWAKTKPRRLIPAGILFGLAAQTRQEAIIVAGLVIGLACLVLMLERRWRCILALALPALLVMSPYFIANASFFGNPFYSAYLDHPVTNVDRSLGEVQENIGQGWAVISSSWWHVWGHQRRITLNTFTLVASLSFPIIIGAALLRRRFLPKILYFNNASPPLAVIALLVLFPLWLKYKTAVPTNLNTLLVLISALGLIALLWHSWQMWQPMKPGRNLLERIPIRIYLVLLTGTSLAGIATWVHPVAKTYYSFIPYLGLVAGLGLYLVIASLFKTTNKSFLGLAGQWLGLALVFSMLSLPLVLSANRLHAALDSFSRKNVEDWLFYNMSRYLVDSGSTDKVTMYAHFLPAQYFLGGDTIVTSLPEDPEPSAALLRDKKVRWIFWTSHLPIFNTFASDPSRYPVRYSIKAFGRDDVLFEGRVIELPP